MAAQGPASILVVDDDASLARGIQILLEDEGHYRVTVISTPDGCPVDLETAGPCDLVIVDLAVLDDRRERPAHGLIDGHGRVPVIVMTAHEAALSAALIRGLDVTGFLSKPIDPETLLVATRSALGDQPV